MYFKSFIQGVSLEGGLELESTFRSSAQGRRYFGAVISKALWHPEDMAEIEGVYQLNSKRNFSIHFEAQFHCLYGRLELYLHYEVSPYSTAQWVERNISQVQREAYIAVRQSFVDALRSVDIPGLKIGGGSNQVAKLSLDLENAAVEQAQNRMSEVISGVATHIDRILLDPMGTFSVESSS